MKQLPVLVAIAGVVLVGCQEYDSPGGVADESVWSSVPADSSEGQLPERQDRQQELAQLEERIANLQYRADRVQSALEADADPQPGERPQVVELQSKLLEVNEDLRSMRALYDEPDAFRDLQERVEGQLDDVDTRLQSLTEPEPEPDIEQPQMDNGPPSMPPAG